MGVFYRNFSADHADRIIGWGCAFGLVGVITLIALEVLL